MGKLFESLFNVRPEEQKKAILMLLYSTCMIATAFIVARTASSTLFLKRIDPKYLPFAYVASAIFVSLFSMIYTIIGDKLRRDRTIIASFFIFTVVILLFRWALEVAANSLVLLGSLYVFVEVMGTIAIIQFWTFASDVFTTREAKRLFAFIGAGGTIAGVVFGGVVRTIVKTIGTPNLLFIMVLLFIVCAFIILQLGRMFSDKLDEQLNTKKAPKNGAEKGNLREDFSKLIKSNHLLTIAGSLSIISIVVIIIDYQFMITVRNSFGDENALAAFFGSFYLYTGIVAFVFQFFITTRLLEKYGILCALLFLPVILLLISVSVLVFSAPKWILSATTSAKGSDNVIRYSVNNPAFQLLYLPIPTDFRSRSKELIEGIIKPIATGISGLLIFVLMMFISHKQLSFIVILMTFAWMLLIMQARKQYMLSLADTIKKKKLDLYDSTLPVDDSTIKALEKALQGDNERNAFNALELLNAVPDKNWDPFVIGLLSSHNKELRKNALRHLGRQENTEYASEVSAFFDDKDPDVRAAAIEAYCTIQGELGVKTILNFMHDQDPLIKSTVVASLMQHGGLDGILMAADEFKAMLNSDDSEMRLGATRVLEIIKVQQFYQPLEQLLQDEDIRVQIGAIRAAGEIKSSFLLPALVEKLSHRKTARTAVLALAQYKENAIEHLSLTLKDNNQKHEIMMQIPRIMRHIGTQKSLNMLIRNLDLEDVGIRYNVITEIARMINDDRSLVIDTKRIKEFITVEIKNYYQLIVILTEFESKIEDKLLGDELKNGAKKTGQRLLALLSLIYARYPIYSIDHGLRSNDASKRANAVELLDNILEGEKKRPILTIFEDDSIEKKLKVGKTFFKDLKEDSFSGWLGRLLKDNDRWIVCCTIYQIGLSRIEAFSEELEQILYEDDLLLTETALIALKRLMDNSRYQNLLKKLTGRSTQHAKLAEVQLKRLHRRCHDINN